MAAAEKFLHNPFATLGPDAVRVLDEAQFDDARREAGIDFERFVAHIQMTDGVIHEVGVVVERMAENAGSSVYERFQPPSDLRAFIARVESKLQTGFQLCEWRHHRLELTGDSADELELLKTAYIEWTKPKVEIRAVDVLDLTHYSQRISGIGVQPRIVSPYISVQSGDDPWFTEPPLSPESSVSVSVPIDENRDFELLIDSKVYETVRRAVDEAEAAGKPTISVPGHPDAIPVAAARAIVEQLQTRFGDLGQNGAANTREPRESKQRKELLLRANIAQSEFAEERAMELQLSSKSLFKIFFVTLERQVP